MRLSNGVPLSGRQNRGFVGYYVIFLRGLIKAIIPSEILSCCTQR